MSGTEKQDLPAWVKMVMYWLENQVAIAFHSDVPFSSVVDVPTPTDPIVTSLKLPSLNQFLQERGFKLRSFELKDLPRPPSAGTDKTLDEEGDGLTSPIGKYFFPSPFDQGTIVIGFFTIGLVEIPHPPQDPMFMSHADESNARKVVNLINRSLDMLKQEGKIPVSAAMPNWLGGATCVAHGCTVVPPIPVPSDASCPAAPGFWPITLPELSPDMQGRTGDGITVFVLDTMPGIGHRPDLVAHVANRVGAHNLLLNEIATEMNRLTSPYINFTYQKLSDLLAEDAPDPIATGMDIYGYLYGFNMPDHGMSVTGIVRDLASKANIEYIRTLNDYGVGDVGTLVHVLQGIQKRMSAGGDLYNKPVVINLSQVVTPHERDLPRVWFGEDCSCDAEEFAAMMDDVRKLRLPLHMIIQSLYELGAVIVASAGNDSHVQQWHGHMESMRMSERVGPRYPAAFPEVISVGAVDGQGKATSYSDYPALPPNHNGIATYGGGLPTPVPPSSTHLLTGATNIDSLRAIYPTPFYPALSAEDDPREYPTPNDDAWAYWSGTSFATPIITAVAARVLEKLTADPNPLPSRLWSAEVQRAITTAAGQAEILTGAAPLPLQLDFSLGGSAGVSLLMAYQCEKMVEI